MTSKTIRNEIELKTDLFTISQYLHNIGAIYLKVNSTQSNLTRHNFYKLLFNFPCLSVISFSQFGLVKYLTSICSVIFCDSLLTLIFSAHFLAVLLCFYSVLCSQFFALFHFIRFLDLFKLVVQLFSPLFLRLLVSFAILAGFQFFSS